LTWGIGGSSPPTALRIVVTSASGPCSSTATGGNGCCANATGTSGTIKWSSFYPSCWNGASDAGTFSPADGLLKVQFQVVAGSAAQTYNYCVTSLTY
jgi:hypothetical protein